MVFLLHQLAITIPPEGSQDITIVFSPTVVQSYSGNITVINNIDQSNNTIEVSGNGTEDENQIDLLDILTSGNNWDQYSPDFNYNYQYYDLDGNPTTNGSGSTIPPVPLLFNEDFTITGPSSNCSLPSGTFSINGNNLSFNVVEFSCTSGTQTDEYDWSFDGVYDETTGLFNGIGVLNFYEYYNPTGQLIRNE